MDCLLLFEYRHSNDLRPKRLTLLLGVSIRDFNKERFFEYHCQFSTIEGNKMPVSTWKRILAPSLQILAMSLLHIIGELMLPLLVNLLSNDVYNVFQSCLSLRMRFFILTMLIILFIVPPVTIKDKGLLLPLFVVFKDKRLLFPLFRVFKRRSDPLIEQCTHSEFTRPDDPLRNDPDVLGIRNMLYSCRNDLGIRNMLHSCRNEMLDHSIIQIAQRVHVKEQVPDVEAALRSDYTTYRSRVLHRRVEIGPQTGNLDLDNLSLQIAKAMRRARQIDENCTLQFGCFALLKYEDGELKWWRLQEDWTPIIDEISRVPLNIVDFFTVHRSQWIIRGSNLKYVTLEASTANEREEIKILGRYKMDSGEDVLLCTEPSLIWRSALLFWKGVYICALTSINDTKEGLDLDLQSESKNVTKVYWTSVAKGLKPSPRTLMFTIANLLSLGICFSLGYISQGMIVFLILSYWWLAAEPGPPIGFHVAGLERIPTMGEDLTNNHSATTLPDGVQEMRKNGVRARELDEQFSRRITDLVSSKKLEQKAEGQTSHEKPFVRPDRTNSPASAFIHKALSGMDILLVEDSAVLQRLVSMTLKKLGANVTVVGDGLQAVTVVAEAVEATRDDAPRSSNIPHFDLILMDCAMPGMDGYNATKAIREAEENTDRHIPIVALTAHALASDVERCLFPWMDAFLTKPIDCKLMVTTIRGLLSKEKTGGRQ